MNPKAAAGPLLAVFLATACATGRGIQSDPNVTGPARVQTDLVESHRMQFEIDDPDRPAGSQGEEIATAYLLGHLQRAGYTVFLDSVPVGDLVTSTNVVGQPPGGDFETIVTASYDTAPGVDDSLGIGVFLELARAVSVRDREHRVGFIALGAEHARASGGRLGSRRLAAYLLDRELDPLMISLEDVSAGASVATIAGARTRAFESAATRAGISARAVERPLSSSSEVFKLAGFESSSVGGGFVSAAGALLAYLATDDV